MFVPSNKLSVPVLGMSLAAISTVLYLSPIGNSLPKDKAISTLPTGVVSSAAAAAASGSASASALASAAAASAAHASGSTSVTRPGVSTPYVTRPQISVPRSSYYGGGSSSGSRGTTTTPRPSSSVKATVTVAPRKVACYDFKWQQDAQAAYLANLSDPWGLDGAPGPANGDGLACTGWPVDPTRAASVPADPFVPATVTPASRICLSRVEISSALTGSAYISCMRRTAGTPSSSAISASRSLGSS